MRRRPIDAVGVGLLEDVFVCNARGVGWRIYRYDAAASDVLCIGCWHLQMMDPSVHAVDGEAHAFAQLVASQSFGDNTPDDTFGR